MAPPPDWSRASAVVMDTFAEAATWREQGIGSPLAVRVVLERPDRVARAFQGEVMLPSTLITVRVSDIATVSEGDSFTIAGELHVVRSARRDELQTVWVCEA